MSIDDISIELILLLHLYNFLLSTFIAFGIDWYKNINDPFVIYFQGVSNFTLK